MQTEFHGANAVVIARQPFNPASYSQAWMIERLGIAASAFVEETTQTPFVFATQTRQFNLFVIPERVQFNLPPGREIGQESEGEMVKRIMREVLVHMPQLSTQGAGFNFNWVVSDSGRPNRETTRLLFYTPTSNLLF